jgi:hypothetical protein
MRIPAADRAALAVGQQRFGHAAGAGHHDRPRLAAVGAEQHGVGVGFGNQFGEAGIGGDEGIAPRPVAHARQPGGQGAVAPGRRREAGRREGFAHRLFDVAPGRLDALPQRRRPSRAAADHAAVGTREHGPRGRAAAIDSEQELSHRRITAL